MSISKWKQWYSERMKTQLTFISIFCAMFVSACGGGGGSSSPVVANPSTPTTPTAPTSPPPDPNALQITVSAATYGSSTTILAAYNELNMARTAYGVGLLAQSTLLDTSASNHANYVSQRWFAKDFANTGHTEDSTKSGFTGVNPADRIAYVKYAASATGETIAVFIEVDGVQSQPGVTAVQNWLSGPYHRFALLDGYRDVGVSDITARFAGEGGVNHAFVLNTATSQGQQQQLPAKGWIGLWPVDNASSVNYALAGESPNPIPSNNGACAGYPVSVQVRSDQTLSTNIFTLAEANSTQINVQLSTAASDVNPAQARANTAYIIPFKPLKLNTTYTAHFVGSANGTAIDKTWSFTTTSQNQKMIYGCDPS